MHTFGSKQQVVVSHIVVILFVASFEHVLLSSQLAHLDSSSSGDCMKRPASALAESLKQQTRFTRPRTFPPAFTKDSGEWKSENIGVDGEGRTGSLAALVDPRHKPHTLILGTQPSRNSLNHGWFFGSDANAFWHIVGDALGFCRGFHVHCRPGGGAVPSISKHLLYNNAVSYGEAVQRLHRAGYAVWDILESSDREGSLDSAIRNEKPAPIQEFVALHPTIRRICFATGKGSAIMFRKHFKTWLCTDDFHAAGDAESEAVFGKFARGADRGIELCVMPSVSPASATSSYVQKRLGWATCFPSLRDAHRRRGKSGIGRPKSGA
mmetsp:Transcript_97247/g.253417  ORF Transcript_97247/g.253417 Transcript_97247/m.253417 type:complete len:323 (-) Transcript_97247:87-1055(-)